MKSIAALVGALALAGNAIAVSGHQNRLHQHAKMAVNATEHHLQKRFSGRATYFAVGLGACGQNNVPSDYIVALNTPQYGGGSPGPQCFKEITITYGGKSAQAKIMDECPTCDYGDLDMSQGLFEHFADTSVGEFQMTWSFGGGAPPPPPPPPKHSPSPSPPPPKPKPTTSKEVERVKPTTHSTTTKAKPTTTKKTTTKLSTSTLAATTTASATPSVAANNIGGLSQFIVGLNNLLQSAAQQHD